MAVRLARIGLAFVFAVILATLLIGASTLLPADRINRNAGIDAKRLDEETVAWQGQGPLVNLLKNDTWNEALILNISMLPSEQKWKSSLLGEWYLQGDAQDSLLLRATKGLEPNVDWKHYWWGSMILLRPLLTVFTYYQIRLVHDVLLVALWLVTAVTLWRRLGRGATLAFGLATAMTVPSLLLKSVFLSSAFYIAMLGACAALWLAREHPDDAFDIELFAAMGIATGFFDYLNAPLITLALPLVTMIAYRLSDHGRPTELKPRQLWTLAIRASVTWAVCWLGFWAAKWLLVSILFDKTIFAAMAKEFLLREGGGLPLADRWWILLANVLPFIPTALWPKDLTLASGTITAVIPLVALSLVWLLLSRILGVRRDRLRLSLILLPLAALPYAWYLFAAQHSYEHAYFAFRLQSITVYALGLFVVYSLQWSKAKQASRMSG